MDISLTDEQQWLSDSASALLERTPPDEAWGRLVEFGVLEAGNEGLGTVELCLVARELGRQLATTPFLGTSAVRRALRSTMEQTPAGFTDMLEQDGACGLALLELGGTWELKSLGTTVGAHAGEGLHVRGDKAAVERDGNERHVMVLASGSEGPALVLVDADQIGWSQTRSFAPTVPLFRASLDNDISKDALLVGAAAADVLRNVVTTGSLIAAADAVGAAGRLVELATVYAGERKQFGHPIGSFQAIRHLLADLFVAIESAWSTVLFAAAAQDDTSDEDPYRLASVAKAYVSRAAVDAVHGALQVFGGVAFTAEHPAHTFQRRVMVRSRQFGDAAHHEGALGRSLVAQA